VRAGGERPRAVFGADHRMCSACSTAVGRPMRA
jgi:hypothetical protein